MTGLLGALPWLCVDGYAHSRLKAFHSCFEALSKVFCFFFVIISQSILATARKELPWDHLTNILVKAYEI